MHSRSNCVRRKKNNHNNNNHNNNNNNKNRKKCVFSLKKKKKIKESQGTSDRQWDKINRLVIMMGFSDNNNTIKHMRVQ